MLTLLFDKRTDQNGDVTYRWVLKKRYSKKDIGVMRSITGYISKRNALRAFKGFVKEDLVYSVSW